MARNSDVTGFGIDIGGGGGGGADVTPGADPARQDLSAGATTATVTFNAAAGGTGSFAYTTSLDKPLGSGATISAGSGLGPWTVSGMGDGQAFVVNMTATDTGDAQIANSCALLDVSTSGSDAVFSNSRSVQRPPAIVFITGVYTIVP